MPLFQNTVVHKYLKTQNREQLIQKWNLYKSHFFNPAIQENIRNSKEEQYQEGFLRDLFVKILGYTLNPENNFNLTTELKNIKDSKKADGGIIINDKVVGVVELKGTTTTDLGKVEVQAFGYKNNQPECLYVITSNFEKLRFYIDNAIEHIEFNLFTLNEQDFELLYLCLGFENIQNNIPKKLKDESLSQEELITKQLYKDYSLFKRELFQNLCELNPHFEPLELFKKSQKLLDRCLFLFFSEDRNLLPPNSVRLILQQWKELKALDAYSPLYNRLKKYFGYLNTGFKGQQYDVFAYNGGLFKPDSVLDNIIIDDELLYRHTFKLSEYDFASEVDVNILGHIFENSLNELDEITAQLEGGIIDKTNTKRKKDGVFYTPKYITKYIVENTIGKLCEEKKGELDITDEAYQPTKQRSRKRLDNLKLYRSWLLKLTICDPACGSGAFLNQALDFLINEHKYIDELSAKYNKDALVLSNVEMSILENNLFGVDLNEESVEIAKLSLWLRIAQRNRKLNDLSNNIKCGNSLIDDVSVAGDKAFNWQAEFPHIFENGGFDVIIGNPPYVFGGNEGISNIDKYFFKESYVTGSGKINLFTLFIEKSYYLLKYGGEFSFIIPNTFLRVTSYHESRKFFIDRFKFRELADLGIDVFEGAVTTAMILIASKEEPDYSSNIKVIKNFTGEFNLLNIKEIVKNNYIINSNISFGKSEVIKKLEIDSLPLGNECDEMIFGVVISKNKDEVVFDLPQNGFKPFLEGRDISSYIIKPIHQYLKYQPELLHRARTKAVFEVPEKLLVQRITGGKTPLKVAYDNHGYYNKESINNIILSPKSKFTTKFILTLLNSTLINWYYNNNFTNESKLTVNISKEYLSRIPVKLPNSQLPFLELADKMIYNNIDLIDISEKLTRTLNRKFGSLKKLTRKLENWYELSYGDFIKELKKLNIILSLSEEAEWEDYFIKEKQKAQILQSQINQTNKEIDQMVYELYGLTEEEIEMVENL